MSRKDELARLKKQYQNLQESYDDTCYEVQGLMAEQNCTDEEVRYLLEFIGYKHLMAEFGSPVYLGDSPVSYGVSPFYVEELLFFLVIP